MPEETIKAEVPKIPYAFDCHFEKNPNFYTGHLKN